LLDRSVVGPQQFDNGPPVGITKSVEGIAGEWVEFTDPKG